MEYRRKNICQDAFILFSYNFSLRRCTARFTLFFLFSFSTLQNDTLLAVSKRVFAFISIVRLTIDFHPSNSCAHHGKFMIFIEFCCFFYIDRFLFSVALEIMKYDDKIEEMKCLKKTSLFLSFDI